MTFKNTLCSDFWLNQESTVLDVFKNKREFIYVIYPVVHYHFHLAGSCLHRCYSHISSKCVSLLFTNHHHIGARLNSLPKDHSLHGGQRPGIAHWALCPSVGDHWVPSTPPLCLRGASHSYNTRGDRYTQVLSLPKYIHASLAFPKLHIHSPQMPHTPHCCSQVTEVSPSLPIKTMCTDISSQTPFQKPSLIIVNPADSLLHFFPLHKSPFKTSLILVSMI